MTLLKVFRKALALGVLSLSAALANPPSGCVEINYHRTDGIYKGWGVHLWMSPNLPLDGIEWPIPMMPSGKSSFGVYWDVPLKEFDTGTRCQVNYIIHLVDTKEQGGRDMAFDGQQHKVIWVWQQDSAIYYSYEDLKAHHPDAPAA